MVNVRLLGQGNSLTTSGKLPGLFRKTAAASEPWGRVGHKSEEIRGPFGDNL